MTPTITAIGGNNYSNESLLLYPAVPLANTKTSAEESANDSVNRYSTCPNKRAGRKPCPYRIESVNTW